MFEVPKNTIFLNQFIYIGQDKFSDRHVYVVGIDEGEPIVVMMKQKTDLTIQDLPEDQLFVQQFILRFRPLIVEHNLYYIKADQVEDILAKDQKIMKREKIDIE